MRQIIFLLFLIPFLSQDLVAQKDIIVKDTSIRSKSKAIMILSGLGDTKARRKYQKIFFSHKGYDLFIPAFKDRNSFDQSVKNLTQFYQESGLSEYEEVYVFSYILGSWAFNEFYQNYSAKNVKRVVYDRSPLQERAPRVVKERLKLLGKVFFGNIIIEFESIEYSPIEPKGIEIGILVENKATNFIKLYRNEALSYEPLSWEMTQFNQEVNDHIYCWINHDELYKRFEVVGNEILHFFKVGRFSETASRVPLDCDPFEKECKCISTEKEEVFEETIVELIKTKK